MENIIEEEWNDEKELEYCIILAHQMSMSQSEFKNVMKFICLNLKDLPPIGIYFNNKIMEIYRFVKNSGVTFSDSYCVDAIETYLMKLAINSVEIQRQFLSENSKKNDDILDKLQELNDELEELKQANGIKILTRKLKYNKIMNEYNEILYSKGKAVHPELIDQYIDICNQILNFSIEKDIDTAINYQIDLVINDEEYNGYINNTIDEYNEELKMLGIEKVIEYRDGFEKPKTHVKK